MNVHKQQQAGERPLDQMSPSERLRVSAHAFGARDQARLTREREERYFGDQPKEPSEQKRST